VQLIYRLASYLEQIGRTERAGISQRSTFWDAVTATVTKPAVLREIGHHSDVKALLEHAQPRQHCHDRAGTEILACQAAEHGWTGALHILAILHEQADEWDKAEALYRADRRHLSLRSLLLLHEQVGDHDRRARPALRSHRRRNSQLPSTARFERSLQATCHTARDDRRQRVGVFRRPR
jgi:hypothetical protein